MPRKCKACKGTYNPKQADGVAYFHACPPLSEAEAKGTPAEAVLKAGGTVERADKRDENIRTDTTGKAIGIVAEGAGVEEV
jgi:hypothetical protein